MMLKAFITLKATTIGTPDREAVVSITQKKRLTYTAFSESVDLLARGLVASGFGKGDRIGIWSTNNLEWLVLQMATARIGVILATINPAYRLKEMAYALRRSEVQGLFVIPSFRTSDYVSMLVELIPELKDSKGREIKNHDLPFLKQVVLYHPAEPMESRRFYPGFNTWRDILERAESVPLKELDRITASLDIDDPINIQYTSGTTGHPKAVVLTHHNILNNAYFSGLAMHFTEKDRLCVPGPFYHCFGAVLVNLLCLSHGACVVIACEHFDALKVLGAIEGEKCTAIHGVPTMFKVVDINTDATVPLGQSGEICFRGHHVMNGYYGDPEATRATINGNGWLYSGDLGTMYADGYVRITGRLKEMIIRGGQNIYPREIEEFIYGHPKVAEVAVFGMPDEYYGEEVVAWIKLHAGKTASEQEIRDFCRDNLAHFKIPRYIWFVEEFPMTVTGKLQKFRMQEIAIKKMKCLAASSGE